MSDLGKRMRRGAELATAVVCGAALAVGAVQAGLGVDTPLARLITVHLDKLLPVLATPVLTAATVHRLLRRQVAALSSRMDVVEQRQDRVEAIAYADAVGGQEVGRA